MKINSHLKKSISLFVIVLNAVFLCFLVYKFIQIPPQQLDWMIPSVMGLFIIINLMALILGRDKNRQQEQGIHFGLRENSKVRLALMAVTALVCTIFGFWMGFSSHNKINMWKWEQKRNIKMAKFMGKKAPDVSGKTLDGKEWKLREQTGKVVMLDFWATWCGPCVSSIPDVKQIYEKYKSRNDFIMVGVSLDIGKDELIEFCKKSELPWIQLFEEGAGWNNRIAKACEIDGIPDCWIIDKNGNVAGMDIHSSGREEIEQIIKKNLGGDTNEPNL
jgi:thiol-disulfide isomerase/thioredoxin